MIRAMPLLDELDLKDHGLTYLESEISAVHSSYEPNNSWVFRYHVEEHLIPSFRPIRRGWRAIESTSKMHSVRDS